MQNNVIDISQKNLHIAETATIINYESQVKQHRKQQLKKMIVVDAIFLFWVLLTIYLPFHALS